MKHDYGFTIVELMIVIAIIGILAAVAYPTYQNTIRKTNRTDARTAITELQLQQEKLRANCRHYGQVIAAGNACKSTAALSEVQGNATSDEGHYTLSLSNATGNTFTITATATTDMQQQDTDCLTIQLDVTTANPKGDRTPAGCW